MPSIVKLFFLPLGITALIAYFTTPLTIKFAFKFGLVDDPQKNKHPKKIHKYPIPRAGGLATYISITTASLLFLPLDKHLIGILFGASILLAIGLLDDKYNLNPYLRLFVQFVAASTPIIAGIGIAFISNPFNGIFDLSHPRISFSLFGDPKSIWVLSDIFALFWIVTIMNFLNHGAKGVPGQLPGVVIIASLTIAILSLKFSADITEWPVIILAAISAGAYLGFLPYNFYPQQIMPAMTGSNLAGFMLGVLSILSTTKVGTLAVVLGIPLVDTSYTIIRRILSGKSPVWGDVGHLHHKLLKTGWSQKQVTLFYWLTTALLGILALNLNTENKLYAIFVLTLIVGGMLLWLTYQLKR